MKKILCVLLLIAFTLSTLSALPAFSSYAEGNDDLRFIRVKLTTQRATVLLIEVNGTYFIEENGFTFTGGTLTAAIEGTEVTLTHSEVGFVYKGVICNIIRSNLDRTQGHLKFNNKSYLGHFRMDVAKDTDNSNNNILRIINKVPMAQYLYGVLAGEIGDRYPAEALKSQALAAKGYAMSFLSPNADYDIVDTSARQVYAGYYANYTNCIEAVDSTIGDILTFNQKPLRTYYAASNGGETSLPTYAWPGTSQSENNGYSVSLDDPDFLNTGSKKFIIDIPIGSAGNMSPDLFDLLRDQASSALSKNVSSIERVYSAELNTPTNEGVIRSMARATVAMAVIADGEERDVNVDFSTELFREYDTTGKITLRTFWGEEIDGAYRVYNVRWGHGVGLSQRGAQQRATNGDDYVEILSFYYPGSNLSSFECTVPDENDVIAPPDMPPINPTMSVRPELTPPSIMTISPVITPNSTSPLNNSPTSSGVIIVPSPSLAPTPKPTTAPDIVAYGKITGDGVNLRSGPAVTYSIIMKMSINTPVNIYDMSDSRWYYVSVGDVFGYVSSTYVDITGHPGDQPTPPPEELVFDGETYYTGVIINEGVNFRSEPKEDSVSLGRLHKGTELYIWNSSGNYYYVQVGLLYGYVEKGYIRVTGTHSISEANDPIMASGVTTGSVNLRTGPGTNYPVVTTLSRDTQLLIYSMQGGWYNVLANGIRGYVSSMYVSITAFLPGNPNVPDELTGNAIGEGTVTGNGVSFRLSPDIGSQVIALLSKNTKVFVYGIDGDWYEVSHDASRGYIHKDYLDVTYYNAESQPEDPETHLAIGRTTGSVNFRLHPSTSAEIIRRLSSSSMITIVGQTNEWYFVVYDGVTGYVSKTYTLIVDVGTVPIASVSEDWQSRAATVTHGVNMRTRPSTDSHILRLLPVNCALKLIAPYGEWSLVIENNQFGFVVSAYIN
ncbi:MAG: SH3 domain-containing protein [Clostridia bacterium]